ncbi:MAG: Holliday junction branch migration DNA helicase RuvB [Deltaproteobacteria bacterium]|nr:MAG: Holliday junction branch migration DNA helicase RuvB [Deltaproteobacteria bacterium]
MSIFDEPDDGQDRALRPRRLDEFVGQARIVDNLRVYIRAAISRGESLDHVLLAGPPGLGKTSLAYILAEEMGTDVRTASGPTIERGGDLAAILTNLKDHEVLFIDEIHRLNRAVEEILYPAMEDFEIDVVLGTGPGAQSVKLPLPRFTLVGATTRSGLLTAPLRARFGIHATFDFYQPAELEQVLARAAERVGVVLTPEGRKELASRARGTPRIALRLLRRVRDFAEVDGDGTIDGEITRVALERLEVDHAGLDKMDRRILHTIAVVFSGGPVGLQTLAAAIGESSDTIEDTYEPYLIQRGLLKRTPRGRVVTPRGREHLGLPDDNPQGSLL